MRKWFFSVCLLGALWLSPHSAYAQVPEIPTPGLPDIARVIMTPAGPVIQYNPFICAQVGVPVCRFFRAHEYGHVALGHALGMTFPQVAEMQADCWAALNAHPSEVQAGIMFFQSQGMNGDAAHGTGFQRAKRIQDALQGNCHW